MLFFGVFESIFFVIGSNDFVFFYFKIEFNDILNVFFVFNE